MMRIKFLQAFNGDCIWISFLDNKIPRNIIIDGGIGNTYENNLKKKGDLFKVIEFIKDQKQKINLLVLTHFDDDHIGGLLKWFNKEKEAVSLIENVWFNSGKEIANAFDLDENQDLEIDISDVGEEYFTSTKQGIRFEDFLRKSNVWNGEIITQGASCTLFGLNFKFLSPGRKELEKLVKLYKNEKDYFTNGNLSDFHISLVDFITDESALTFQFKEDLSITNGSSIAFIMEYDNKNFLFVGDAHPRVVTEGLKIFEHDKDNPLTVELFKISHHGSQYNTNNELLNSIKTENYVICSDGSKHGLPNKRTIARIIKSNPEATIYFNYDLRDHIFLKEDWTDYDKFKAKITNEFIY